MATHTYKKCPHCGKTYEHYTTYSKNRQDHSGSPFIKCRFCGGIIVDKDIKEPALKPYEKSEVTVVNCIFAMFYPWGLMGIGLTIGILASNSSSIALWIIAAILDIIYFSSVIFFLINRARINKSVEKEYEESYKRLQNPEYAKALKDAGFDVPSWFLKGQK